MTALNNRLRLDPAFRPIEQSHVDRTTRLMIFIMLLTLIDWRLEMSDIL